MCDQKKTQQGQSLVEMLIVLPLLALLIFGVLELVLAYQTRATLNVAVFDAARAGATANATLAPMNDAYARGMAPLFVRDRSMTDVFQAQARVRGLLLLPMAPAKIEIISPSRAVFDRFKARRRIDATSRRYDVIPNDNLMWRSAAVRSIGSGDNAVKVNVQDANLLKVRALWCHKLVVPLLDRLIHWTWALNNPDLYTIPEAPTGDQMRCDTYADAQGGEDYYIPIVSYSVVRMQSPVLRADLPTN